MKNYSQITKRSKVGRAGKLIKCPTCEKILRRVYHLSWTKLTCLTCNKDVGKYEWLIEETLFR